jgi:hypothetical protein
VTPDHTLNTPTRASIQWPNWYATTDHCDNRYICYFTVKRDCAIPLHWRPADLLWRLKHSSLLLLCDWSQHTCGCKQPAWGLPQRLINVQYNANFKPTYRSLPTPQVGWKFQISFCGLFYQCSSQNFHDEVMPPRGLLWKSRYGFHDDIKIYGDE